MLRLPLVLLFFSFFSYVSAQERVRLDLEYTGGLVVILADQVVRDSAGRWVADGNVVLTYEDSVLRAQRITYDPEGETAQMIGEVQFSRGLQWLKASEAQLNLANSTGTLRDVEGFTDQELYIRASVLHRTGPETYEVSGGFLTSCAEAVPIWSFAMRDADIQVDSTARVRHTFFRIKNIPVFYFPYMILPTGRKERSSGLLLPTTGNSSNKGRRLTQSFYLTLGDSADLTVREDYFSLRGLGHGIAFRARPNSRSFIDLDSYMIRDRRGQGGASLNGVGETQFGRGFRAVADFNLISNFTFRQVFSDNFYTATQPTENSRLFLTNESVIGSLDMLLAREQTFFPGTNVVVSHSPSLGMRWAGRQVFGSPLHVDLDSSVDGLNRNDPFLQTAGVTSRYDLFPQIYTSIPLVQGLRLTPRLGRRETWYSDSRQADAPPGVNRLDDRGIHRRYTEFTLDLRGWGLSKVYQNANGPSWKHLIEPAVRYRYLTGIDRFDRIIFFDEQDAVADTNEVEYGLFNRFFVRRRTDQGFVNHEWLSVSIGQKYFLDPDFGGAVERGASQFYPLYTLTGYPYGAIARDLSPATTRVRITPQPGTSLDVRGDYDFRFGMFRNFSVTGFLGVPRLSVSTTYFVTRRLEPGTMETNQIQGNVFLGRLDRGLSLVGSFSYDARSSRFLSSHSRINYFWECFGLSVEVQGFNVGVRQERQVRFSFFLKGIGAFGTIRRPDGSW
jgi:LPS-assembly protein